MLFLLLSTLLLSAVLFLLHEYLLRITGLKYAVFYCKCDGISWIAETAWLNHRTGEVCKITTTSNWQDGVISVFNNHETIYHTKQPFNDRLSLQRFHRAARTRFFLEVKLRSLIETKNVLALSRRA